MDTHHLWGGGPTRHFAPWSTTYSLRHLGTLRNLWFGDCPKVLGMSRAFSSTSSSNIYLELGQPFPLNHPLKCLRSCQVGEWFTASINKCQLPIIYFNTALFTFYFINESKICLPTEGSPDVLLGIQLILYHLAATCPGNLVFHKPFPTLSK